MTVSLCFGKILGPFQRPSRGPRKPRSQSEQGTAEPHLPQCAATPSATHPPAQLQRSLLHSEAQPFTGTRLVFSSAGGRTRRTWRTSLEASSDLRCLIIRSCVSGLRAGSVCPSAVFGHHRACNSAYQHLLTLCFRYIHPAWKR